MAGCQCLRDSSIRAVYVQRLLGVLTSLPSTGRLLCPFKVGVGAGLQGGVPGLLQPSHGQQPSRASGPGKIGAAGHT